MTIIPTTWRSVAFAVGVVALAATASAKPFVPQSDAVVLERLAGDPALAVHGGFHGIRTLVGGAGGAR